MKGALMKIRYEFADGAVEIEVADDWGNLLINLDRQGYNNNQKEGRRHISLDSMDYEGEIFADDTDIAAVIIRELGYDALYAAMDHLLPQQRALINKIYFEERSLVSVAREEGVGESAIRDRLNRIYQKIKKSLK
jgi:DNA-directed RNA polymerase specialized sigma24 family protein